MRGAHRGLLPAVLCAVALSASAETQGPYTHGVLRQGDGKLIVCHAEADAVAAADAVNQAFLAVREEALAAPDEAAREALYETKLYPSVGWQTLMGAIYTHRCDLARTIDHTSRRTVMAGPEELAALGARHAVVESEVLDPVTRTPFTAWIVTTEAVPPPP